MSKEDNESNLLPVGGVRIIDVILEFSSAGKIQEIRNFVSDNNIVAYLDVDKIDELKAFLRAETSGSAPEAFVAAKRAERSDPPCGEDR